MDGLHTAQLVLRIALAAAFGLMGVLHFAPAGARSMRAMIPPPLRRPGWPAALAVFPANAYAARDPARFGRLAVPFWSRLGIQLLLIALVLLATWPLG